MKTIITLGLGLLLCLQSCQAQSSKNEDNMKDSEITADNFVDKVWEQIEHYDREPMYLLRIVKNNCLAEVFVNDYIVEQNYGLDNLATPVDINYAIFNSGEQTVSFRLYPIGDLLKEAYGVGETVNSLNKDTYIKIQVLRVDHWPDYPSEEKLVVEYMTDSEEFKDKNLPYYEYTFSFEAKVPYQTKGWQDGVDLRKLDQKELESKVLDYYRNFQQLYLNKDLDKVLNINFNYLQRLTQAGYEDKTDIEDYKKDYVELMNIDDKDFFPLKDYEMQFFGNGKLVCLRYPTVHSIDRRLDGKSSFIFKYARGEGNIGVRFSYVYLYLPKDQYKNGKIMRLVHE